MIGIRKERIEGAPDDARNGGWRDGKLWSMTDLAEMADAMLPKGGPRGPYKKENSN